MARPTYRRARATLGVIAGALLLAACSGKSGEEAAPTEPSAETLAALLAQEDGLSVVSATIKDAGLAQAFDNAAAYTLLAPQDAAFDSLGETGTTLRTPEQRPALVAVLRDHIVPGYLTPADIAKAIAADDDGKVTMKTMAGHTLSFTSADGTITATGEDGATARFAGHALLATNGVAIPVDGLAVNLGKAEGS